MASRIRKKAAVAAAISALMAERSGVTSTAVVNELGAIAFSNITDYLKLENGRLVLAVADLNDLSDEAKAAIAKLRERVNHDGSISIEVELHDKISALDRLGKSIGLFKERSEVAHRHEVELVDPLDRINARLEQLRKARAAEPFVEIEPPLQRHIAPPTTPAGPIIDAA
jgi:phage terminase small subunit